MGHHVISIEPFYDNIIRMHKSAYLDKTTDKITVFQNALSNQRNEIKRLNANSNNKGDQGLIAFKHVTFKKEDAISDKYLVETILLDDIVDYLPKNYKKAIIKIDIQGFEAIAFQCSKNLFKKIDIQFIFMEWDMLKSQVESKALIEEMIDFFTSYKLIPFDYEETRLKKENWQSWPYDIVWKKA
jgi:FkbM family methyltransferase